MMPEEMMSEEESAEGEASSAQRLYELGQELMDMAIAQGYSPEEEMSEEPSEESYAAPADSAKPKKSGKDKVKIALGFFGK